jgi:hypothetical protein
VRPKKKPFYAIRLGVAIVLMLDSIRHSFCQHDAFDYTSLAVGFAVLVLTAYTFFSERIYRRKLDRALQRIGASLAAGQNLQDRAPGMGMPSKDVDTWNAQSREWIEHTTAMLASYSPEASTSFRHNPGRVARYAETHQLATNAEGTYTKLQDSVNNLQQIMEVPAIYIPDRHWSGWPIIWTIVVAAIVVGGWFLSQQYGCPPN